MRLPALSFAPLSFQFQILPFVVSELVPAGLLLVPSGLVSFLFLLLPLMSASLGAPFFFFSFAYFCCPGSGRIGFQAYLVTLMPHIDLACPMCPRVKHLRILEPTRVPETAGLLQCSHSQLLSCN